MHGAIFMSYSTQATLSLALLAAHGSSNTASKVHGEFDILRCTRIILILALRAICDCPSLFQTNLSTTQPPLLIYPLSLRGAYYNVGGFSKHSPAAFRSTLFGSAVAFGAVDSFTGCSRLAGTSSGFCAFT